MEAQKPFSRAVEPISVFNRTSDAAAVHEGDGGDDCSAWMRTDWGNSAGPSGARS